MPTLAYRLLANNSEVFVLLRDIAHGNQYAPIEYQGEDEEAIALVQRWLEWEHGAFGHLIKKRTTPIDLAAAMAAQRGQPFQPKRISGGELVEGEWNPGTPPGAIT